MLIAILIIVLCLILWALFRVGLTGKLVSMIKDADPKQWVSVLYAFLRKRAERNLLITFMVTEAGLIGVLPSFLKARVRIETPETFFDIALSWSCANPDWLTAILAIIILIGYLSYLYITNKKNPEEWSELIDSARIINQELNFVPTVEWFESQNQKALKSLGKRYSDVINFPYYDMPFALASFSKEDAFMPLIYDDLRDFIKSVYTATERNKDQSFGGVIAKSESVLAAIKNLNESADSYLHLKALLGDFSIALNDYYYIATKDVYYIRDLREKSSRLLSLVSNNWIAYKNSKVIFVTGEAGCGKSHLIGDIVTKRVQSSSPSILLLGQHFTEASDPLTQIGALLDIRCRKERLLSQLNDYGARKNTPIIIFIDAINEGAGQDYWQRFLDGLTASIEEYDFLKLVVSFRISEMKNWFYDLAHDTNNTVYVHKGFQGREREAAQYMFSAFGLDQPLWPMYGSEFTNPLFLLKYCRNHEKSGRPLLLEDFWKTINDYCNDVNHDLSVKFGYNDAQELVLESMQTIASMMVARNSRWNLEYSDVIKELTDVAQYTRNSEGFIDLLIDEGLLRTEHYEGKTYVSYGFERIGDYFIADCLLDSDLKGKSFDYRMGDLSEALAVISPYKQNKELFEIVEIEDTDFALDAFLQSAGWRDTFLEEGRKLVEALKTNAEYEVLWNLILSRPFREDNCANGSTLYELLWGLPLAKRDEVWTVPISQRYESGQQLFDLVFWAQDASIETIAKIPQQIIWRCLETIVWSFSTTWRQLRDIATHALVALLRSHNSQIIPLLEKYYLVNDPYIQERLWASVYGTIMFLQDKEIIFRVGEWTYQNVFVRNNVPEHVLVRDYTKNIVEYALAFGWDCNIEKSLIQIPFQSTPLPKFPTTEEINRLYKIDWNSVGDDRVNEYRAQSRILSSMATEYYSDSSRRYGDFGRYVFQSYIEDFGEDVESLSNWAVSLIFEKYGYDPKVFANFDAHITNYDRSHNDVERIGKKYQWITLYRIMALLMDKYPDKDWTHELSDPVISARTIDPSLNLAAYRPRRSTVYKVPNHMMTKPSDDMKWLKDWKNMPKISKYVICRDNAGVEWINLFSYTNIIQNPTDVFDFDSMKRDLWVFIQGYIAKEQDKDIICKNIYKFGIPGRRFHENKDVYGVFAREYYWAGAYKLHIVEDYFHRIEFSVDHKSFPEVIIEPTYLQYLQESCNDATSDTGHNMLLPNECLFKGLGLKFSDNHGAWVNEKDELIAFDNSVYTEGHSALLVRKDVLLEYLSKEGKFLFWPVLCERMVRGEGASFASHVQCGGWAYMDNKGEIHQHFKCYEPSDINKKWQCFKKNISSKTDSVLLKLHKNHLIWLPKTKKLKLYYGEDYNWLFRENKGDFRINIEQRLKELSYEFEDGRSSGNEEE